MSHHTLQVRTRGALRHFWQLFSGSFGEAWSQPGVCRGSVSSPMIGDLLGCPEDLTVACRPSHRLT